MSHSQKVAFKMLQQPNISNSNCLCLDFNAIYSGCFSTF